MAEEESKRTPPYIPYKTFDSTLNGLADSAVPHRLDHTLLHNMSGTTRSGLMVGMRFLGLIDDDNNTKPILEKLAHAKGDARKAMLREIVQNSYGFMGTLDLMRATPGTLAEAVGKEGATGGTREKAVAFFLKVAEAAGIEVSPFILKRKHAPTPNKKPRRAAPKGDPGNGGGNGGTQDQNRTPTPPAGALIDKLMAKFPDMNEDWPNEVKAKWFDNFTELMNRITPKKNDG